MANNNDWNQPPNDFAEPPEGAVPPFNAEHGFRRLRFAEINEGESYVIKRVEKFRQGDEEEWSYDTVYSYVRIVRKTDDEVAFLSLFTRRDNSEWEFNVPDPDLEEFAEETLEIEQVNEITTEEFAGGLIVKTLHHFYAPEPEANALSNASSTFSGYTTSSETNGLTNNNSNASSVISTSGVGGGRKKLKMLRRRSKKLKKTIRRKRRYTRK